MDNPIGAKLLRHFKRLSDTFLAYSSSGVSYIAHEDSLKVLVVAFFSELDRGVANELNSGHADAPLGVLEHGA